MNARLTACLSPVILAAAFAGTTVLAAAEGGVERLPFGRVDGRAVDLYVLTSPNGSVAKVMTYGATLTELDVPDRSGRMGDVVLGFDSIDGYLAKEPYFGATVGRVGNRIARGRFVLDGRDYRLATNDGPNHLHGGIKGFDKVVWDAEVVTDGHGPAVKFSYVSADGEEGYPGTCRVSVVYQLRESTVRLSYEVTTDKDTPVNVTNHSYFNLSGPESGDILGDELTLFADRYTPVDATLIPTGELRGVEGTPMDFRSAAAIGARIREVGGKPVGYDHNFVLNPAPSGAPVDADFPATAARFHVATVHDPRSGRVLDVWTTEPGVQFYTSNFLDGTITGKKGVVYRQYQAFALETQHFPDSVNHPNFPSYVLKAGDTYRSITVYRFTAR